MLGQRLVILLGQHQPGSPQDLPWIGARRPQHAHRPVSHIARHHEPIVVGEKDAGVCHARTPGVLGSAANLAGLRTQTRAAPASVARVHHRFGDERCHNQQPKAQQRRLQPARHARGWGRGFCRGTPVAPGLSGQLWTRLRPMPPVGRVTSAAW